jgi:hypothetical protein
MAASLRDRQQPQALALDVVARFGPVQRKLLELLDQQPRDRPGKRPISTLG